MNIRAKKKVYKDEYGYNNAGYHIIEFEPCCDRIKEIPIIECSQRYDEEDCNNQFGVFLHHNECWSSYRDDFEDDYYYKLKYCPFCGKKIVVSVNSTEDLTDEYNRLTRGMEEMNRRIEKTDSIKERDNYLQRKNKYEKGIRNLIDDEDTDYFKKIREDKENA